MHRYLIIPTPKKSIEIAPSPSISISCQLKCRRRNLKRFGRAPFFTLQDRVPFTAECDFWNRFDANAVRVCVPRDENAGEEMEEDDGDFENGPDFVGYVDAESKWRLLPNYSPRAHL